MLLHLLRNLLLPLLSPLLLTRTLLRRQATVPSHLS
jgi:hypothetical protein